MSRIMSRLPMLRFMKLCCHLAQNHFRKISKMGFEKIEKISQQKGYSVLQGKTRGSNPRKNKESQLQVVYSAWRFNYNTLTD